MADSTAIITGLETLTKLKSFFTFAFPGGFGGPVGFALRTAGLVSRASAHVRRAAGFPHRTAALIHRRPGATDRAQNLLHRTAGGANRTANITRRPVDGKNRAVGVPHRTVDDANRVEDSGMTLTISNLHNFSRWSRFQAGKPTKQT